MNPGAFHGRNGDWLSVKSKAEAAEKGCPANLPLRFIPPKSSSPAVQKQVSSRLSICLRAPPAHEAAGGYGFAATTPPVRQSLPSLLALL